MKGSATLLDAEGNECDTKGRAVAELCRCGGSATKHLCDGTHRLIGFGAAERVLERGVSRVA